MATPTNSTATSGAADAVPGKGGSSPAPKPDDGGASDPVRDAQRAAADLLVFAPIGLVKRARTILPDLVREGRSTVSSARTIGKFVTPIVRKQGAKVVRAKVAELTQPKPRTSAEAAPPAPAVAKTTAEPPLPRQAPASAQEPFPGYDHLGSAAVVARLGELSARERAAVLRYEKANRNRRTILGRIDQLNAT